MELGEDGFFHLTYCTNIHSGNGWAEVAANLERYTPDLKARLSPDRPFGLGLRLSADESRELLQGDALPRFREFLEREGLYVFTLNGFPYGQFHKTSVKTSVHEPDWRTEERVQYTLRLIQILADLLPATLDGGISTSPLSYKSWISAGDGATWKHLTRQIVRVCQALMDVRRERGKLLHLDLEPEPDALLDNCRDVVRFYAEWLLPYGSQELGHLRGIPVAEAQLHLLDHIRVSYDTCHSAVAYEDPRQVLDQFARLGIQVGKVQIGSALRVIFADDRSERGELRRELGRFADSVYLHQVGQRNRDGSIHQYPDLEDALPAIEDPAAEEWRVHFHVPIFVESYGRFLSTQDVIRRVLDLLRQRRFTRHLEMETYTWDVLPPDLKRALPESISREYDWVLNAFAIP